MDSGEAMVSGRMLLRRIPTSVPAVEAFDRVRLGWLGYSPYTYRVTDLDHYRRRIAASRATDLTDALANELGERSFPSSHPTGTTGHSSATELLAFQAPERLS